VLLAAAFAVVYSGVVLPPSLAGAEAQAPYIVLAAGAALAVALGRGLGLIALVTLGLAYWAQHSWLLHGLAADGARAVYLGLAVFVPINLALASALPERGTFNRRGALRLAGIALEAGATAWIATGAGAGVLRWASQQFLPVPLGIGALPQAGIAALLVSLIVALAAAFARRSAFGMACAGAIVAFAVGAHVPTAAHTLSVFTVAAGLMVILAMLHDAVHRRAVPGSSRRRTP
jgi:hypothetical protein